MREMLILWPVLLTGAVVGMELEPVSSAELCGSCHRTILEAWKQSAHAVAMESRLFQDALEEAQHEFGAAGRQTCLGCHAPLALLTGDSALRTKVSWEGVTCDYCHSMRGVATDSGNPKPALVLSSVKSGPLKEASSGAHGTVFSEVHTSSLVCAPCHQYRNALGFDVLTTYREWWDSRYFKEEVQCQACHMDRVAGDVVDPRIKRSGDARVNLHAMPGGHSLDQLNKAVRTRLVTNRGPDRLDVSVELLNVSGGHYVPTGSPMRELKLEVHADAYRGRDYHEERSYRRSVGDAQGTELTRELDAFFKAAKVLSDTRLAPDEKRTEKFSFAIPRGVPVQVTARLTYYYSPMSGGETRQHVVFRTISRFVK
jgi:hypothetical protein